ncbi:MAG: dTMP kinase, partial [Planctomycetales bacterium]|nr:dTMP kinase [Planctomycetales bacterium]
MASSGILIAVEGIDGAGKTTLVRSLADALSQAGESIVVSKEPTDGPWGRKIRRSAAEGRMSLPEELHAFVEDRKEHVAELIRPGLDAGKIVLLDRYFYSTIAYQGARGADVAQPTRDMLAIAPQPDLVLLLDADPAEGLSRISTGRQETPNEFEKLDSLAAVRAIFL